MKLLSRFLRRPRVVFIATTRDALNEEPAPNDEPEPLVNLDDEFTLILDLDALAEPEAAEAPAPVERSCCQRIVTTAGRWHHVDCVNYPADAGGQRFHPFGLRGPLYTDPRYVTAVQS